MTIETSHMSTDNRDLNTSVLKVQLNGPHNSEVVEVQVDPSELYIIALENHSPQGEQLAHMITDKIKEYLEEAAEIEDEAAIQSIEDEGVDGRFLDFIQYLYEVHKKEINSRYEAAIAKKQAREGG